MKTPSHTTKPFIKWVGGKSQLLKEIDKLMSVHFVADIDTYIEPFVGGGAVLFHVLHRYPHINTVVINDVNTDLINTYKTVKNDVTSLITILDQWQHQFYDLLNEEDKKQYFYHKRELFNQRTSDITTQSALFIFLNKTCFNGLYRVNRNNGFNVPIGSYKKPVICDHENLQNVHSVLQKVEILNGDFEQTLTLSGKRALFYFDPPYKPLNKTSSFTAYAQGGFDDDEQIRLANFCKQLDSLGHTLILSNSDVKGNGSDDDFFDELYQNFNIERVIAKRNINSKGNKRGAVTELLISNHKR